MHESPWFARREDSQTCSNSQAAVNEKRVPAGEFVMFAASVTRPEQEPGISSNSSRVNQQRQQQLSEWQTLAVVTSACLVHHAPYDYFTVNNCSPSKLAGLRFCNPCPTIGQEPQTVSPESSVHRRDRTSALCVFKVYGVALEGAVQLPWASTVLTCFWIFCLPPGCIVPPLSVEMVNPASESAPVR